jgi:2-methylisocitrate lyase-like PEP mutase family enzyme
MRTRPTPLPKACGSASPRAWPDFRSRTLPAIAPTRCTISTPPSRVRAARDVIDRSGDDVLLVGRAEGLIRNRPDFDDILRRLKAYSDAGADCLYAPGLTTREQIEAVVQTAGAKPVNVLMGAPSPLTVADLEKLGVRRISVGGSLARSAWGGFMRAAQQIQREGNFNAFADAAPSAELNKLLGTPRESAR